MAMSTSVWAVGENVPWSVAWTSEDDYCVAPDPVFRGLMEVVQSESPWGRVAAFRRQPPGPQQAGPAGKPLSWCGRVTEKVDRWLFPAKSGGLVTMPDGSLATRRTSRVHKACGEKAGRLCPHLSRRFAQLVLFPADEETRVFPRTDMRPGLEPTKAMLFPGQTAVLGCVRLFCPRFSALRPSTP